MGRRVIALHPEDFSPAEIHQINALVTRLGKACDGKPAHIVGVALQAMVADVMKACADDEASLHGGVDAFARDVKGMITDTLFAQQAVH